jgi:hypothetical protein
MRDRLIELIDNKQEYGLSADSPPEQWLVLSNEDLADYLIANGVIVPPCKVGDCVLWDNGLEDSKPKMKEVKGFYYNSNDLGLRYILEDSQPIISHSGIVGIIPKEDAEEKLKELE